MNKNKKFLTCTIALASLFLVGCSSKAKADQVSSNKVTTSQDPLKNAESIAAKNKVKFNNELSGLKREQRNYDEYVDPEKLPKTLEEAANSSNSIIRAVITDTSFEVQDDKPITLYKLFVKEVYHGDKSLVGKTVTLATDGGKIKNSDLYKHVQEETSDKLTPEELQKDTVVQTDGSDPAAPGDEIVGLFDQTKNDDLYHPISSDWIFYKANGDNEFKMHRRKETLALCGNSTEEELKVSIAEGEKRHFEKEKDRQKIEQQVNEMVKTKKDPLK